MKVSRNFPVPAAELEYGEEIKKSRFLTQLRHTAGKVEAKAWIAQVRAQHPQARHCCWAHVAGEPGDGQAYGFSDDGEPAGTAGKPLLNLLLGSGLGQITVIVVRYYGGIKLGTGGLVRAYGHGVAELLKQMSTRWVVATQGFDVRCGYEDLALCQWAMDLVACESIEVSYGEQIRLRGLCPCDEMCEFETVLRNRSHGRVGIEWVSEEQKK